MKWIDGGMVKYAPAVISRNNVINIDNDDIRVDKRFYTEESPRRWYFLITADTGEQLIQVVSMAYESGWDSWDKYGEALRKYMNGEVEILMQKTALGFDFDNWNGDWSLLDGEL